MIKVDKIVTISLKENTVRQHSAQTEITKLNIKTDFFLADRDVSNGERGCFNSHVEVCRQALNEGCQHILIFEDDVKIRPFQPQQIDRINRFITNRPQHFEVLYLGLIIGKMWFCGLKSIVRAKGSATHAYILSRSGMEKLAAYDYDSRPIDKVFKHDFKCFSVYPIIAEQYPEDILHSQIASSRNNSERKNDPFWEKNYRKQRWILWKNLHKTLFSWLSKG